MSTAATNGSHSAEFQTSDRCVACHNGMVNSKGDDYSIGLDWRVSLMANSSRDPYWQASVRRETRSLLMTNDKPAATNGIVA